MGDPVMHARLYKPGTDAIDITAPGGIAALLAFHRRTFGNAVMKDGEDDGDDSGDDDSGDDGEPKLNEHGFPDKTPWKEMEPAQQAAYWRHQAKRHESRANAAGDYEDVKAERDRLKAEKQTPDEKAAEEARTQAAAEARADERAKLAPRLVTAKFESVGARGNIPSNQLESLVAGIHAPNFLTADGEVDTDKVTEFLEPFMKDDGDNEDPKDKKWPDMGQGRRSDKKAKGVSAGAALYADRHTKK
jgi:hypothetical protein